MKQIHVVEVIGGLGNQMFQYAFLMALQAKGACALLDLRAMKRYDRHSGYELERLFGIHTPNIYPYPGVFLSLFTRPCYYKVRDTHVALDALPVSTYWPIVYYRGYWQNPRYFLNIEEQVRKAFTFDEAMLSSATRSMVTRMQQSVSVSVHVRRGDYESLPDAKRLHGGISTPFYYKNAVAEAKRRLGDNLHFYLFSDDFAYAATLFEGENITLIDWNRGDDSWQDIYMMSNCNHHIIANSTFSWWGAWLNPSPEKLVIAPARWRNVLPAPEILLPEWVQVSVDNVGVF